MKGLHDKKLDEFAQAVKQKRPMPTAETIEAEERMRHNARVKIMWEVAAKEEFMKLITVVLAALFFGLYCYFMGF